AAGSTWIFHSEGTQAVNAPLGSMAAVAFDSAGNLYVADYDENIILKVLPSGVVTVVAGNGLSGYSGDGGPARNASLNSPLGVALDSSGNIYISDNGNNRIRRVSTSGIITTYAGNGVAGFAGDGGLALNAALNAPALLTFDPFGNLLIADQSNNRIRQ